LGQSREKVFLQRRDGRQRIARRAPQHLSLAFDDGQNLLTQHQMLVKVLHHVVQRHVRRLAVKRGVLELIHFLPFAMEFYFAGGTAEADGGTSR
jgi:hypothetical protein